MKILFVDTDCELLGLGRALLEEEGFEVKIATTGQAACDIFNEEATSLSLIVIPILLPDIDGIKILRIIKTKCPNLPVIVFTFYDYRDDFAAWDSDMYIVKGENKTRVNYTRLNWEELISTINKFLLI